MKRVGVAVAVLAALCLLVVGCAKAPPNPTSITAAQRKAATEADLKQRWEQVQPGDPTFRRPTIAIIRYVNYLNEGRVLADCMRRAGYRHVAWTLEGGIVDTDVKPVDRFPVEVAIYVCEAQYPSDPLELGYLSDAQEQYMYSYWADETVPCLRAHGAIVKDLPPVGQFGEGYEDVGALNPFSHAKLPRGVTQGFLLAACPPYPGQLYAEHKQ